MSVAKTFLERARHAEPTDFKGVEALDPVSEEYRQAIIGLIRHHGTNELLGGPRIMRSIAFAPDADAAREIAEVAADEIRHGAYCYGLLKELRVDTAALYRKVMADQEGGDKLRYLAPSIWNRLITSWTDQIAFLFLVDLAGYLFIGDLMDSNYAPYARVAARILREEAGHMGMSEEWAREIGNTEAGRAELQRSVNKLYPLTAASFGRPGGRRNRLQRELGLKRRDEAELIETYRGEMEDLCRPLGLTLPGAPPDFSAVLGDEG